MIAFLCDEHSKAPNLLASYPALKESNPLTARYMGSLTFGKDEDWAALQAADLIAGLCKDFSVERFQGNDSLEGKAQVLRAQMGDAMGISYLDESLLRKIVEANHLHNGRPSIRSARQQKLFSDLFDLPTKSTN